MKKIIGTFIVTLLIATAVSSIGMINRSTYFINNKIDDNPVSEFVPGEFIVKFKDKPSLCVSIDELNEKHYVRSMEKIFRNSENTILDNIYILGIPKDSDISAIVDDYSSCPDVVYAEPNYIGYLLEIPNDHNFSKQWSLHNTGQTFWNDTFGSLDADIDAPEAWDIETGSEDVIIAIIDTGVDYTHPDLADNIWINEDEIPDNDIDDDNNGYIDDIRGYDIAVNDSDPIDPMGHGTACAGVASGVTNNGIGIAGVCWNSKIMVIKSWYDDGNCNPTDWGVSIKYAADNGANVISMSFGYSSDSSFLKDAVDYAYSKDIVLVAGAGNDNKSKMNYPAGFDNVIAVAATNQNNERCTEKDWGLSSDWMPRPMGSQYGDWIDVAAPGNFIYTTAPTYWCSSYNNSNKNTKQNNTPNYDYRLGTSFSCPHVAGLAALLLSKNPSYSPEKVRLIIRANVDPYVSEHYIGTGRINAYKAITEFNTQPDTPTKPSGRTSGRPNRGYAFSTSASDPDGDQLLYMWDWGDGNYSEWLDTNQASHTWTTEDIFEIRVKVKDGKGGESYWSEPLSFSTPKARSNNNTPFLRFLERHPLLFPILRQIMGL